jgi:hypothetical protein
VRASKGATRGASRSDVSLISVLVVSGGEFIGQPRGTRDNNQWILKSGLSRMCSLTVTRNPLLKNSMIFHAYEYAFTIKFKGDQAGIWEWFFQRAEIFRARVFSMEQIVNGVWTNLDRVRSSCTQTLSLLSWIFCCFFHYDSLMMYRLWCARPLAW